MSDAWMPMEQAPKDGSAFLAYGRHGDPVGDGAARGVQPGDQWWAIILWDVWRTPRWVFAKDGAPTWSDPLCWHALRVPADLPAEGR